MTTRRPGSSGRSRRGDLGRPWWASAGPGDEPGAPEEPDDELLRDPLYRDPLHRDPLQEHLRRLGGHLGAQVPGQSDVCQVCPVCSLLRVFGDARPELMEHLTEAARHLTLAAKAVIDAQAALFARPTERLERITLDEG